jgi:hypothetical protein
MSSCSCARWQFTHCCTAGILLTHSLTEYVSEVQLVDSREIIALTACVVLTHGVSRYSDEDVAAIARRLILVDEFSDMKLSDLKDDLLGPSACSFVWLVVSQ